MSTGLFARELRPAQKIIATVVLAFAVLGCALHPYVYHDFLIVPYFAVGLACILILQLRVMASMRDAFVVVAIGLALLQVDLRLLGYQTSAMAVLSLFGLASLLMLGWRAIWDRAVNEPLRRAFVAAAALSVAVALTGFYIERTFFWHIRVYDLFLYSFDSSLGKQWTFLLAQHTANNPAAHWLSTFAYDLVLVPPALVYAAVVHDERRARIALWAFLIVAPLAAFCFLLFPATGPLYAFRTFPKLVVPASELARLIPTSVDVTGPRNAIPSLHFAWVLLAYWNSRETKSWIRVFCAVMVVLTIYATLMTGEHYGVDLLLAVPFALGVQGLSVWIASSRAQSTVRWAIASFAVVATWLTLLRLANRMFWISPVVPWSLVILTMAVSVLVYRQLVAAEPSLRTVLERPRVEKPNQFVHPKPAN